MDIEFQIRVLDMTEEEREQNDRLGMDPKKRYVFRRVLRPAYEIYGLDELDDKFTRVIFFDNEQLVVKGNYNTIKEKIDKIFEEPESTEEDLEV